MCKKSMFDCPTRPDNHLEGKPLQPVPYGCPVGNNVRCPKEEVRSPQLVHRTSEVARAAHAYSIGHRGGNHSDK